MTTRLVEKAQSTDGSVKFLFQTPAGHHYEALYFKFSEDGGLTETPICCLSSQVGCAVGCIFCATGRLGFRENLSADALLSTVRQILAQPGPTQAPPEILTFMGMGEPLLNIEALIDFYQPALALSGAKSLSLSSVVLPRALARLAESPANYDLFVSLHSPWEEGRRNLIPLARQYEFKDFFEVCDFYYQRKLLPWKRKIKFSYLLLPGVNDSPADISELISLLKARLAYGSYRVQLLLYNDAAGNGFKRIAAARAAEVRTELLEAEIDAYLSFSRGTDVGGGCGQFAGRRSGRPLFSSAGPEECRG